jgi:uncharacterized protein (DUF1697 family)
VTMFVALLRAVNVGGQNRVPMAELRERLSAGGLRGVQTYVQSGNVTFEAEGTDTARQAGIVHDLVQRDFDLDVQVLALAGPQLEQIIAGNPFLNQGADEKTLHVTFLFSPVPATVFADLKLPAQGGEQAVLAGSATLTAHSAPAWNGQLSGKLIYLHLPLGYGRSKLSNPWFERVLKTPATTRNWRTVLALRGLTAE